MTGAASDAMPAALAAALVDDVGRAVPARTAGHAIEREPSDAASPLTPRQFAVVSRFAFGQTIDTIARELRIGRNTVYRHRTEAIARYDAASINDLWMRLGWLHVPEEAG